MSLHIKVEEERERLYVGSPECALMCVPYPEGDEAEVSVVFRGSPQQLILLAAAVMQFTREQGHLLGDERGFVNEVFQVLYRTPGPGDAERNN